MIRETSDTHDNNMSSLLTFQYIEPGIVGKQERKR